MKLKGKTAIVTGAAHGIGRAIAELFAEEGSHVFVVDLDEAAGRAVVQNISQNGGLAEFISCDVSVSAQVAAAVAQAAKKNGRVDVLCNNAAFFGEWHGSAESTEEEWQNCFRNSLLGAQYFTREVLPFMIKQRCGSIINMSSVQGMVGARNSAAYTSVKHGLIGFTRSVAYDYGPHNIRCNALCPGAISTRISPEPGSELHQRQIGKTFLGRIGQPREVAYAALFLASDESSYVTGAVLAVDGGWTAM